MKKKSLILVGLCLLCSHLLAQTAPGAWLFSPLTVSQAWAAPNEEGGTEKVRFFSGKVLYFPLRRVAAGGQFQYHAHRASWPGRARVDQVDWWLMPTLRYYLSDPDEERPLRFFAEAGASFFTNLDQGGPDWESGGPIGSLGLNYFLNGHMALEVLAGYLRRNVREKSFSGVSSRYVDDGLNVQVALRLALPAGSATEQGRTDPGKARWLLGAAMDLDSDDDGVLNRHPFFLKGRVGYFPVSALAAGIEGGIDLGGEDLSTLRVAACREAGAFARYYFRGGGALAVFPEIGYSFSRNIYPEVYASRARTIRGGLGLQVPLQERTVWETLLQYRRHQFYSEDNDRLDVQQNGLTLEMGLVYFLPGKRTGV